MGELVDLGKTQLAYSPNLISGSSLTYVASTNFQITLLSKFVGKQYMGNIDSENSILPSYFINDLIVKLIAYFSFFVLAKKFSKNFFIISLISALFASSIYYKTLGYCLAFLPYLIYSVSFKKKITLKHYLIIILL